MSNLQYRQSEEAAHNQFSRAQQYAAYTRAQLDLAGFAKQALACITVFTTPSDAFSPDLQTRQAAIAYVQKKVLTPLSGATDSLVNDVGAIDVIASDNVRKVFDNIQTQSQTYNGDCQTLLSAIIDATPAEKAAGSVTPAGERVAKEMNALVHEFNIEIPELTQHMRDDLAVIK
jgi:hypothetical protein